MKQGQLKKIIFFAMFFVFNLYAAGDSVFNLVITNSFSDKFEGNSSSGSNTNGNPVMLDLFSALSENEMVLCPKALWNEVLNLVAFVEKQDWIADWRAFQEKIKVSNGDIESIKSACDAFLDRHVSYKYLSEYSQYEVFKELSFACKDVCDRYVLFIPKRYSKDLAFSYLREYDFTRKIDVSSYGCSLGEALKELSKDKTFAESDVAVYVTGHGIEDGYYSKIIELDVFNYQDSKKLSEFSEFLKVLQFGFKIDSLTIISCFAGGNIKNAIDEVRSLQGQKIFEDIRFPIMISSAFNASFATLRASHARIILSGSDQQLKNCLYQLPNGRYLYGPEKSFNGKGLFGQFFTYMNQSKTMQLNYSKIGTNIERPDSSWTALQPDFVKAAYLLGYRQENVAEDMLQNVFLLRYPHTSYWFPLEDLQDKKIAMINKNRVLTHPNGIEIGADVDKIFLSTRYVISPLMLNRYIKDFYILPIVFDKKKIDSFSCYYVKEIRLDKEDDNMAEFDTVIRSFFHEYLTEHLEGSFVVLIGKMVMKDRVYQDTLVVFKDDSIKGMGYVSERKISKYAFYKDVDNTYQSYSVQGSSIGSMLSMSDVNYYVRKILEAVREESEEGKFKDVSNFLQSKNVDQAKAAQEYRRKKAEQEAGVSTKNNYEFKKEQKTNTSSPRAKHINPQATQMLKDALELASLLR